MNPLDSRLGSSFDFNYGWPQWDLPIYSKLLIWDSSVNTQTLIVKCAIHDDKAAAAAKLVQHETIVIFIGEIVILPFKDIW